MFLIHYICEHLENSYIRFLLKEIHEKRKENPAKKKVAS